MSAAEIASNKATFARLHDAVNSGDVELISKTIDEVVDQNVRIGTPLPVDGTGAQALKQVWTILLRAYPDRPPTGKSVTYNEIFIFRFVKGRIAETWGVVDVLSQMRQLGVIQA